MPKIEIPLALQIVIDDVGWWSGKDESSTQGPYRTGFVRDHVPADYQAIVDLGRQLNMRPQSAMIMQEWDPDNWVASLPSASKHGASWKKPKTLASFMEESSDIIRQNSEFFEITLHGIGHEYWQDDSFTRGEWYDKNGMLRPIGDILDRLDLFEKLLDQYNLGSFPESFVPPSFTHIFSPDSESLIPYLKERNIQSISTPFSSMLNAEKIATKFYGFDQDLITIDRGHDPLQWDAYGHPPKGIIRGPICGMHWPNLLHKEPDRNHEIVDMWVQYLKNYENSFETILARDTQHMITQLRYKEETKIINIDQGIELNFAALDKLSKANLNDDFIINVKTHEKANFTSHNVEILNIEWKQKLAYYEVKLKATSPNASLFWS